ncbi:MAG: hypothetical protein ABFS41_04785 [Myxococcota bacterium]
MRGARRTLRAAVQAYLYAHRSWYILYRPLPEQAPPPSSDFELRLATAADLESLAVFEPNRHRREFRDWLESGAFLFVAFADGRPVAFQCFALSLPVGPPLSSLRLEPGQLWAVDVQTLPAYRRHHAAQSLRAFRDHTLRAQGVREYVSSVQSDNLPTLSYAYGGRRRLVSRVERLSYLCLLGLRRIRIERDARPRLERLLREAGLLGCERA